MDRDRTVIVARLGAAATRIHARRLAPCVVAIAGPFTRILDRIRMADQRDIAVVLEIVGIGVALAARVETQERELGEEQFRAIPLADLEFVAIITVAVDEMVAVGRPAPTLTIVDRQRRSPRPAAMPQARRYPVGRRGDTEDVGDRRFVPADQRMIDVEAVIGRPMPIEEVAVGFLAVPVLFDALP